MAENSGIARPYAEAAFELARELGQLGAWSDVLHAAAEAVSNDDVMRVDRYAEHRYERVVEMVAESAVTPFGG